MILWGPTATQLLCTGWPMDGGLMGQLHIQGHSWPVDPRGVSQTPPLQTGEGSSGWECTGHMPTTKAQWQEPLARTWSWEKRGEASFSIPPSSTGNLVPFVFCSVCKSWGHNLFPIPQPAQLMSGEHLQWQRQSLLNCISCNAHGAKLESISLRTEKLKEKKNSFVSVMSSSSTDHSGKILVCCFIPVCESTQNAEEVLSLVTFHKASRETGKSNEQSQLPAATIAKPSRAEEPWETQQGSEKFKGKWQKGVGFAISDRKPSSYSDGRVLAGSYSRENEMIQHLTFGVMRPVTDDTWDVKH